MKKFFFVFALAACGGGGGNGGGDPVAFQQDQIETLCARAFECMSSFPQDQGFAFEDLFGTSEGECVMAFSPDATEAQELRDSVDAGRVIFNSADANACANDLETVDCDGFWNDPAAPECDTVFVGTVADGGTCTIDLDCSGEDSFCDEELQTCGA